MNMRLPPELRSGIVMDALTWFARCEAQAGISITPAAMSLDWSPARLKELGHSVRSIAYRTPYTEIGTYMERFWFLPEIFGERARVHRTLRSDRGRDLHDHPWHFVSIIIAGGYTEEIELAGGVYERHRYRAGDVILRHAEHRHRLEIEPGDECVSLVFTSEKVREWGFWTPSGFVPWEQYDQLEPA